MDLSRTCPLFVLSLLKRFLALLAPGYNQGMDVERSCRAPAAFRESCRAAFYTVLVLISVPLAIAALVEWRTFPAVREHVSRQLEFGYSFAGSTGMMIFASSVAPRTQAARLNQSDRPRRDAASLSCKPRLRE
jgi:hypothetical protein